MKKPIVSIEEIPHPLGANVRKLAAEKHTALGKQGDIRHYVWVTCDEHVLWQRGDIVQQRPLLLRHTHLVVAHPWCKDHQEHNRIDTPSDLQIHPVHRSLGQLLILMHAPKHQEGYANDEGQGTECLYECGNFDDLDKKPSEQSQRTKY